MKALKCLLLITLFFNYCYSQDSKRNNNWILGFSPVVKFNFNTNLIIDSSDSYAVSTGTSCISDTNGYLLFYNTGFAIVDKDRQLMSNGLDVNCPYGNILANYYGHRSLFDQTSIILPKKGNTYYVFSTGMSDSVANNYLNHIKTEFDVLNYSVVDMDSNNGKGQVVQKNIVLADKRHYNDCALHAVKHANGKDWWLVKADCENDRYEEYIVTGDTIFGPYYQNVPSNMVGDFCTGFSEIMFSPDGSKMASTMYGELLGSNFYYLNNVFVFDFDRCDGKITFKRNYRVPEDTSSYPNADIKMGICFSPDGKLLYESNSYTIYQIDLDDTNSYNALLIHGPDTVINKFPEYSTLGLAPNGKIYIGNFNGTRKYMSYIDKPNVKGLGCDFVANGVWQPYTNLLDPPNMPNYGLGADSALLVGCWPVAINQYANEQISQWDVYPNPSSSVFYIKNRKGKTKELYNSIGQLIVSTTNEAINVASLQSGFYYLRCEGQTKKVIVE